MTNMESKQSFWKQYAQNFVGQKYSIVKERQNVVMLKGLMEKSCSLYQKDLMAHYGCVNAIEFSPRGDLLASGGDDRRLLLWKVQSVLDDKPRPTAMKGEHSSNIFCIAFSSNQKTIFSAGNDEQVLIHDAETGQTKDVFLHTNAIYGVSIDPQNDNVFASASDDGKVLIWDIRQPPSTEPFCLTTHKAAFYSVMYNPIESSLIATANNKNGVALWDIRKPFKCCLLRYGGARSSQSAMSIRFNSVGTKILALRRRLPPILYDIHSSEALNEFNAPGYYNSCTMKSCCFAGYNDEYVLSGSDDFKLYMWKIPSERSKVPVQDPHMILKGHRSIVNQVRFDPSNFLLASSGVEKVVKLWSVFPIPGCKGNLNGDLKLMDSRKFYSPEDYINLVLNSGVFMTHDYSHHSVHEDARMMAFFDSLVQRDIEGWASDSTDSFSQDDPNWEVTSITSDSNAASASDSSPASHGHSDTENSDAATVNNRSVARSANELNMEISDILSERIAAKRKELKGLLSGLAGKKKAKKIAKKRQKVKRRRIVSSSSSDEEGSFTLAVLPISDNSDPNRGFFSIDGILGPPIWHRIIGDSRGVHRRRSLQTRIRFDRLSNDSESSDASLGNANAESSFRTDPETGDRSGNALEEEPSETSNNGPNKNSAAPSTSEPAVSNETSLQRRSSTSSENEDRAAGVQQDSSNQSNRLSSDAGPSGAGGNVTWAEFKRFKNKVKRASRHYRKRRGDYDSE